MPTTCEVIRLNTTKTDLTCLKLLHFEQGVSSRNIEAGNRVFLNVFSDFEAQYRRRCAGTAQAARENQPDRAQNSEAVTVSFLAS